MTKNIKSFKIFLLTAITSLFISAAVPVKNIYTLSEDYVVTIHGTSNLHNWDQKVGIVSGDGIVSWNKDGSFDLDAINIKMDVHSIKSDKGSIMNNKTYKALKADDYPQIIFMLTIPVKFIQSKINEKAISAKGNLTIAGVTKSVDMQVKVFMQEHERLAFEGSQIIKMTDYGVAPPTAFFGTLKTGDEITLNFKTSFTTTNNLTNNSHPEL
ncbi:MAG: YceI family protein [Bacteroidia bacterium]